MKTHGKIQKWGNSSAVRLSTKLMAAAGLEPGAVISIETKGGKVIIEPISVQIERKIKLPFTERQLLSGLTAHTAHADELAELAEMEASD